jgi:hypothetical protein
MLKRELACWRQLRFGLHPRIRSMNPGGLALFEFGDDSGQNRPDFVPAGPASRPQAASSTVRRESAKLVPFAKEVSNLKRLNVGCLPALRPLNHIELHSLTLLEALEAARRDCGVMCENVFAVLTADEAKPLGIVKPLHCSLFHSVSSVLICCPAHSNWGSGRIVAKTKLVPVQGVCILAPRSSNCGIP